MVTTKILWQPAAVEGETLHCEPQLMILILQRMFAGEFPITLAVKDLPKLEGAVAACSMEGNPFLTLIEQVKRYKHLTIWVEHEAIKP